MNTPFESHLFFFLVGRKHFKGQSFIYCVCLHFNYCSTYVHLVLKPQKSEVILASLKREQIQDQNNCFQFPQLLSTWYWRSVPNGRCLYMRNSLGTILQFGTVAWLLIVLHPSEQEVKGLLCSSLQWLIHAFHQP